MKLTCLILILNGVYGLPAIPSENMMAPVEEPAVPVPTADSLQFQVKLWSGVKKNINEFVEGVQQGASLFKNVLKMPFEQMTSFKPMLIHRKLPYYIAAASTPKKIHVLPMTNHKKKHHKKSSKKPTKKQTKKSPNKHETFSEEHLHYDDKGNLMPELTGKHVGYDSDGPNNYNIFKDKFLKEIEQKEEQNVEATMDSFYDSKGEIEFIDDRPYVFNNGWNPIEPSKKSGKENKSKKYIPTEKPREASKLHTNVMSFPIETQTMIEESSSNIKNTIKSTERPNYPDYFFEIQTTVNPRPFQKKAPTRGKTQIMEESVRSLVIVDPGTRYISTTTTYAPITTRKSRRANIGIGTSDWKIQSNRGNIKFGDKVTNENL